MNNTGAKNTKSKKDRQSWIAKAYTRGLRLKLTANEVATWAKNKSNYSIERGDIQYYSMKNNLPSLPELTSGDLKRSTKYG